MTACPISRMMAPALPRTSEKACVSPGLSRPEIVISKVADIYNQLKPEGSKSLSMAIIPRFVNALALLLFGLASSFAFAGEVHRLGPDLYAYISSNDSSANSTFLVSDAGILVVDTGLNEVEGKKLLAEIRKISPAPVRWIVNTHYHPDHRGGNLVVGPEAVIISTAFTRAHAAPSAHDYAVNETVGPKGLTLYLGGHEVRIYHPGPAHTLGDLIVYFPDE